MNCAKTTQFSNPCPELCEICTIHANFSRFSIPTGKIVKIHAICVILKFCRFCMIHTCWETTQATVNSAKSTLYLLIHNCFVILSSGKAGSGTLFEEITPSLVLNYTKSTQSALISYKFASPLVFVNNSSDLCKDCSICQPLSRTMQNLHNPR